MPTLTDLLCSTLHQNALKQLSAIPFILPHILIRHSLHSPTLLLRLTSLKSSLISMVLDPMVISSCNLPVPITVMGQQWPPHVPDIFSFDFVWHQLPISIFDWRYFLRSRCFPLFFRGQSFCFSSFLSVHLFLGIHSQTWPFKWTSLLNSTLLRNYLVAWLAALLELAFWKVVYQKSNSWFPWQTWLCRFSPHRMLWLLCLRVFLVHLYP